VSPSNPPPPDSSTPSRFSLTALDAAFCPTGVLGVGSWAQSLRCFASRGVDGGPVFFSAVSLLPRFFVELISSPAFFSPLQPVRRHPPFFALLPARDFFSDRTVSPCFFSTKAGKPWPVIFSSPSSAVVFGNLNAKVAPFPLDKRRRGLRFPKFSAAAFSSPSPAGPLFRFFFFFFQGDAQSVSFPQRFLKGSFFGSPQPIPFAPFRRVTRRTGPLGSSRIPGKHIRLPPGDLSLCWASPFFFTHPFHPLVAAPPSSEVFPLPPKGSGRFPPLFPLFLGTCGIHFPHSLFCQKTPTEYPHKAGFFP